jgi:cytochrome c oxidase subunit 2
MDTGGMARVARMGFRWGLPADASLHGPALDHQLLLNLWVMAGLLLLAHVVLFGGMVRRREERPRSQLWVEWIPLAALTLLFAWFAVSSERLWAAERYTGADPAAMQVEVTGMQFAWYFRYPGSDAAFGQTKPSLIDAANGNPLGLDAHDPHSADDFVSGELVLPVGREVDLRLRSIDVIHGFAVPEMRLKQNAVPGQTIHIHFTPESVGTYAVMCTQLCGMGHYRMQAKMRIVSAAEFAAWETQREAAVSAARVANADSSASLRNDKSMLRNDKSMLRNEPSMLRNDTRMLRNDKSFLSEGSKGATAP